ncbi:MAG: FIST C-terminal domain-containing protein [Pseudomonadota bacterium]|nr:FIST C-terminal domain-containing protein [Pseudomonadota bacterium]
MTQSLAFISTQPDTAAAAAEIGQQVRSRFDGQPADALVVFASPSHQHRLLLEALAHQCGTHTIVGASSAGEFTNSISGEGYVSVLALRSSRMRFSVAAGRNIGQDPLGAARSVAAGFRGIAGDPLPHRAALVMADALAGHTDALVEELTVATGGNYRFFGGGAGDDARFSKTFVFAGTEVLTDAVVALEMLSMEPIGIGVAHGWEPTGPALRVTEAQGSLVRSLNGAPAVEAFSDHAQSTGQRFDADDPIPFFLHNILGIDSGGQHRLRVPLGVHADGSISCAAAVPQGTLVHIMKTNASSAIRAAEQAARAALESVGGGRASAAIVFDCVATRLRLGAAFDDELRACADLLSPAKFIGCNTYGQIARAEGQFGGFHNCTAVVCVLPD